jgi:hypothetical protein
MHRRALPRPSSAQIAAASSQSVLRRRLPCCLGTAATWAGLRNRTTSPSRSPRWAVSVW